MTLFYLRLDIESGVMDVALAQTDNFATNAPDTPTILLEEILVPRQKSFYESGDKSTPFVRDVYTPNIRKNFFDEVLVLCQNKKLGLETGKATLHQRPPIHQTLKLRVDKALAVLLRD